MSRVAMDLYGVPFLTGALRSAAGEAREAAARISGLLAEGGVMGPFPAHLPQVATWAERSAGDIAARLAILSEHIGMGPYAPGTWVAGRMFDDPLLASSAGEEDGRRLVEILSADVVDEDALDRLLAEIGAAEHDPAYLRALLAATGDGLDLDDDSRLELATSLTVAGAITRSVSGARESVLAMDAAASDLRQARNAALRSGNPATRAAGAASPIPRLPPSLAALARNPLVRRGGPVLIGVGAVVGVADDIDSGMSTTDAVVRNGAAAAGGVGGATVGGMACGALAGVSFGVGAASCVVLVPAGAWGGEWVGRRLGGVAVSIKDGFLGLVR
jgi:hypothetical protein